MRNFLGLISSIAAMACSVVIFAIILEGEKGQLPRGDEFLKSSVFGFAILIAFLLLLRPQRWTVVLAVALYLLLIFPVSFEVGCGLYGQCI